MEGWQGQSLHLDNGHIAQGDQQATCELGSSSFNYTPLELKEQGPILPGQPGSSLGPPLSLSCPHLPEPGGSRGAVPLCGRGMGLDVPLPDSSLNSAQDRPPHPWLLPLPPSCCQPSFPQPCPEQGDYSPHCPTPSLHVHIPLVPFFSLSPPSGLWGSVWYRAFYCGLTGLDAQGSRWGVAVLSSSPASASNFSGILSNSCTS